VGGSQSAVEIILHLSEYCPDAKITGTFKNFGYRQKDCSPFTGEVYFPEFVDFFYNSSLTDRRQLTKDLYYTNYSAVDSDVLDQLYRKLYLQKLTGHNNIHLHRLSKIMKVELMGDMVDIEFEKMEEPGFLKDQFDMVVLATGFKNIGSGENEELFPDLLKGISGHCQYSREDGLLIDRDYRLKFVENLPANLACYVNGLCESSHGMGDAGSLSLVALRAEVIINSLQQVLKKGGITERMPVALSA
jgi:L-ornithine N5-oxygenase